MIPRDTHDGAFYRAVLALHQDLFSLAQQVRKCVCRPAREENISVSDFLVPARMSVLRTSAMFKSLNSGNGLGAEFRNHSCVG